MSESEKAPENLNITKTVSFADPPIKEENEIKQSQKIDLSLKYKYIVLDKLTESVVGIYPTNKKANGVIIKLVKNDLNVLIQNSRMNILFSEDINENRIHLNNIKQAMYQLKTIEQSNMIHMIIGDKNINRYRIVCVVDNDEDIDECDLVMY
jgi:hypothetical protein